MLFFSPSQLYFSILSVFSSFIKPIGNPNISKWHWLGAGGMMGAGGGPISKDPIQ
jgi:hypothetical protein